MLNAAGQNGVLRTLALLLAALSRATPKQAKEPKVPNLMNVFMESIFLQLYTLSDF